MPLIIVRNDITKMKVDAIVNAANKGLKMGGGVCGAIFSAAGAEKLQAECDEIGGCKTGSAVITKGYDLYARYIIHTAGPVWRGGEFGEAQLLRSCYISSLNLAVEHKCKTIAFPLISSGIYGYPKEQALKIATDSISEFLLDHEIIVYLVVFDKKAFVQSEKLFSFIERYIDDNYAEEHLKLESERMLHVNESVAYNQISYLQPGAASQVKQRNLEDVLAQLDESFSEMLLRLIDEKGMKDVEAYKRANVDRRLFSKIRSAKGYNPSKTTAVAFAIALRLNIDETLDLLAKAGYTLSRSSKFDVIIMFFIESGNYNVHEINEALFVFGQELLGA